MEETSTDLSNVLNDQHIPELAAEPQAPDPVDQGELQAEPPAAKPQEPDHVPRAALQDERRKRQELEQRLAAYEQQLRQNAQPPVRQRQAEAPKALSPADFGTYEQYLEAVAEAKAEEKAAKVFETHMRKMSEAQQAAQLQQQTAEDLGDMLTAGRSKYADFDTVVGNPNVPITDIMMNTMMAIDGGHEAAYHLATNPAEAARIARMPPSTQAREVGRLAKQLAAPAPAPVVPTLPKTLTTTRSTDGRFAGSNAWTGPAPLTDILKGK